MIVRRYVPGDFAQIQAWAKDWGTEYIESQFPEVGFIVDGYVAYFLYQSDSTVCFLENLISNKNARKDEKSKAIDLVITEALSTAWKLGYGVAYATTDIPQAIVRAMVHGAKAKSKHTLLIKKLTDPSL